MKCRLERRVIHQSFPRRRRWWGHRILNWISFHQTSFKKQNKTKKVRENKQTKRKKKTKQNLRSYFRRKVIIIQTNVVLEPSISRINMDWCYFRGNPNAKTFSITEKKTKKKKRKKKRKRRRQKRKGKKKLTLDLSFSFLLLLLLLSALFHSSFWWRPLIPPLMEDSLSPRTSLRFRHHMRSADCVLDPNAIWLMLNWSLIR